MPEKTKHIFPDLRPDEDPSPEDLLRGSSLNDTKGVILKRMILEILPYLEYWISQTRKGDALTIRTLQEVKANKGLYSHVNEKDWNNILESFTNLIPEVHIWKNPPEGVLWMADPKRHPFQKRAQELLEIQEEETILIGWNQYSGVIACEIIPDPKMKPLEERESYFPKIRTKVISDLHTNPEDRGNSIAPNAKLHVWAWDKRNFDRKH